MVQQLKTRNINDVPGKLFCCQCKAKFQSVINTDNGFTESQTPRKKLQSTAISPVSLHAFTKTLESNILEA